MKKLIIIGAGGHGKVVSSIAMQTKRFDEIYFVDDHFTGSVNDIDIIGKIDCIRNFKGSHEFFVAIGNNKIRKKITDELLESNYLLATLSHQNTVISDSVEIGKGTVIMPGVIINNDAQIGSGCIINTNTVVEHDCIIGDFVHLSPSVTIAGTTKIGNSSWIGTNATLINNLTVGENVIVGASGLVIDNLESNATYVGIPVKKIGVY